MFCFLETDVREQKVRKQEMICIMKSSLKIAQKTKITFLFAKLCFSFLNKNIFYSWRHIFFKIPNNLIVSAFAFFFVEVDTKNIDMHQQKP